MAALVGGLVAFVVAAGWAMFRWRATSWRGAPGATTPAAAMFAGIERIGSLAENSPAMGDGTHPEAPP